MFSALIILHSTQFTIPPPTVTLPIFLLAVLIARRVRHFLITVDHVLIPISRAADNSTMSTSKLGIAMYNIEDERMGGTYFHWALVAHETRFDAPLVNIFELNSRLDKKGSTVPWFVRKLTTQLSNSEACVGVVDVGTVKYPIDALCTFLKDQRPNQEPGEPTFTGGPWSCASWVIRALVTLAEVDAIQLPIPTDEICQTVLHQAEYLKHWRSLKGNVIYVIPLGATSPSGALQYSKGMCH